MANESQVWGLMVSGRSGLLESVVTPSMRNFRLRRADFIRNLTVISAFMAVAYYAVGAHAEAGATVISGSIGIPLAWLYLRWRRANLAAG